MEPFRKEQSRPKRSRYRLDPTLVHFDHLFGAENWSRFLVLKTGSPITAAKLEHILLTTHASRDMSFRPIRANEWLIETTTKAQSEKYQSLSQINGVEVTVTKHDQLNSIQGTVVLPQMLNEDGIPERLTLLESLQKRYPNVQDIEIYEIKQRKDPTKKLRIAKIKFEGQDLPQDIKIEGQKREIRPFVPKPLQCRRCSKYGHTDKRCLNSEICAYCGSSEHQTKWNCGTAQCSNCGQNHHARSKECIFYIYNTELKLLVSRTGMSIQEAKLELKARGLKDPGRNPLYKTSVRSNISHKAIGIDIKHNLPNTSLIEENIIPKISKENQTSKALELNASNIKISNAYEILSNIDNEIDCEDSQEETEDSKRNKRNSDSLTPPKSLNKVAKSVRPRIKRDHERSVELTENEDLSPSPIFTPKFKTIKNSKTKLKMKEISQMEDESNIATPDYDHESSCGCHSCFVQVCSEENKLSKDSLRNIIQNFISNKKMEKEENLNSHTSECLCVEHLKFYRKNKVKVLDKILNKHNENESNLT